MAVSLPTLHSLSVRPEPVEGRSRLRYSSPTFFRASYPRKCRLPVKCLRQITGRLDSPRRVCLESGLVQRCSGSRDVLRQAQHERMGWNY